MGIVGKILGIMLAGVGAVIMFVGMNDPVWSYVYLFIGLMVMSIGFSMLTSGKPKEEPPPPPTVTDIRCDNPECTFKEIRDFKSGDYILKPLEATCPKCQNSMTIHGVYIVREEPDDKDKI
ncbi:MAG: hypothetical protein ACFE7R_00950 [Candidatus Hodarchaeota archaeon]